MPAKQQRIAVIIGEAKAGHPDRPAQGDLLSSDDLDHLEAIQDALRAIGMTRRDISAAALMSVADRRTSALL